MKIVFFCFTAKFFKYLTIMKEVSESRPEVGSSSMITAGSLINSKAIDVLFFYPPEIPFRITPPTITSKHFYSFSYLQSKLILSFFYSSLRFSFKLAANCNVSLTVNVCISTSVCITQLAKSPKFSQLYSTPFAQTVPSKFFFGTRQAKTFKSVVFPAPEAPIIAATYPPLKTPDTSLSNFFCVYFLRHGKEDDYLSQIQTEYEILLNVISIALLNIYDCFANYTSVMFLNYILFMIASNIKITFLIDLIISSKNIIIPLFGIMYDYKQSFLYNNNYSDGNEYHIFQTRLNESFKSQYQSVNVSISLFQQSRWICLLLTIITILKHKLINNYTIGQDDREQANITPRELPHKVKARHCARQTVGKVSIVQMRNREQLRSETQRNKIETILSIRNRSAPIIATIKLAKLTKQRMTPKYVYLLIWYLVIKIMTVMVAIAEVEFIMVPLKYQLVNQSKDICASLLLKNRVSIKKILMSSFDLSLEWLRTSFVVSQQ